MDFRWVECGPNRVWFIEQKIQLNMTVFSLDKIITVNSKEKVNKCPNGNGKFGEGERSK